MRVVVLQACGEPEICDLDRENSISERLLRSLCSIALHNTSDITAPLQRESEEGAPNVQDTIQYINTSQVTNVSGLPAFPNHQKAVIDQLKHQSAVKQGRVHPSRRHYRVSIIYILLQYEV